MIGAASGAVRGRRRDFGERHRTRVDRLERRDYAPLPLLETVRTRLHGAERTVNASSWQIPAHGHRGSEVRRQLRRERREARTRRRQGRRGASGGRRGRRRHLGDGQDDGRAARAREAGRREPAAPRARYAAHDGRARLDGAAVDGHPEARRARDLVHRLAERHHHERSALRRAHPRGTAASHRGRARARQGRHRRGLPGHELPPRDHDARPRWPRHDGHRARRCPRRGARGALPRRRRCLHGRPAPRAGRETPGAALLRGDGRGGREGAQRDGRRVREERES